MFVRMKRMLTFLIPPPPPFFFLFKVSSPWTVRLEDDIGIACHLNTVSSQDFSNECHTLYHQNPILVKSRTTECIFFLLNEFSLFLSIENSTQDTFLLTAACILFLSLLNTEKQMRDHCEQNYGYKGHYRCNVWADRWEPPNCRYNDYDKQCHLVLKHVRTQQVWLGGESMGTTGTVSGSAKTTQLLQWTILQSRNKLIHAEKPTPIKLQHSYQSI